MKQFVIRRLALAVVASALVSSTLTACVPLLIGGAAAGGTLVATDRRTSGAQLEDEGIELRGISRIRSNIGDRAHINLTSYNRQILLTGEVPTAQDKALVEQIVTRVENVSAVVNELAVMGNSSLMTSKIRTTFCTPGVERTTVVPRSASRCVTRPIR